MSDSLSHEENNENEFAETSVLKKGPWASEEDAILTEYVTKHGMGNWNAVSKHTGLARCGKSCRLRWSNHLRPDLKKGAFTDKEQQKIIELHALMGNKWARMAQELPGRTDNEIKNFWNTRQKKRKRAGLPLYPDDIKPATLLDIDKQESSLNCSTQEANDSRTDTLSTVPELIFNNYKFRHNHPLNIPLISDITKYSTFEQEDSVSDNPIIHLPKVLHDQFRLCKSEAGSPSIPVKAGVSCQSQDSNCQQINNNNSDQWQCDYMAGGNACSSEPLSVAELHSLPSLDDTFREINFPIEDTEYYESFSPRSSGLLESMFYSQKIMQNSHNFSMHPYETQREPNSGKKENMNILRDFRNPNVLADFSSLEKYGKDQSPLKDSLLGVIQPYINKNTSSYK